MLPCQIAVALSLILGAAGTPLSYYPTAFLINTSPLAALPFSDCPICPDTDANMVTGSCSCPAGSELIQPLVTVSDCAFRATPPSPAAPRPLRPAHIGICLPVGVALLSSGASTFGGAFQQDLPVGGATHALMGKQAMLDGATGGREQQVPFATGVGCRSPNLVTGVCTCPDGFSPVEFTLAAPATMPGDADTPVVQTNATFCVPSTGQRPGFGGAYQNLDPAPGVNTPCAVPNPFSAGCSCPSASQGWTGASQSFRVVSTIPGTTGQIVGSTVTLCFETPQNTPLSAAVEVCDGVTADSTGLTDASGPIQACIDAAGNRTAGTVALPPGTYRLEHRLTIRAGLTLSTRGVAAAASGCGLPGSPACAVFRAAPELEDAYGLLLSDGVNGVTLDHIVLDGNRGGRMDTGPALSCGGAWAGHTDLGRSPAYNAGIHDCTNCTLRGVASMNALCGTGCEFRGSGATFDRCLFLNNGDHFGRQSGEEGHKWSDGLTINSGPQAVVKDCVFQDNSDINLIIAEATNAQISGNVVRMVANGAFGGIMLDNFNSPGLSDHSGAEVSNNTVDCGSRCHYGIELGPRPWYTAGGPLKGPATVTQNRVGGAGVLINADGAGIPGAPFILTKNTFVGGCVGAIPCVSGQIKYNCSLLNISPNGTVDRQGETAPAATAVDIVQCP